MRILHLIPNMLSGGAQQQVAYLAAAQRRSGWDVHLAFVQDGPKARLAADSGASIHRLAAHGSHDPFLLVRVWRLIRTVKPDVVQTWILQMDVLGGLAARLTGRCWVLSERASAGHYASRVKVGLRALVARRADAIVSNSMEGDRYWAPRVGPNVLRRVIRNGVPSRAIASVAPVSGEGICLRSGERMVLYAGRFSPQKNLETLIPALGLVCRRLSAVAFLCGDGTHEEEAKAQIGRLGLEHTVRFVGYVENVWSWMKRADVFVSVSHFEGNPNTVLEAAVVGCPLVLSDIPEHREMLKDSEALFVDRTSPDAIADGIERTLREPDAARRRAEAARRAVEPFSVEVMAASYEKLYREVLDQRRAEGAR